MSVELINVLITVLAVGAILAVVIQKSRLLICLFMGCVGTGAPSLAQEAPKASAEIRSVEVDEPRGQILSFRHLADSTVVQMRGTRIEPGAAIKMKVESRPGFLEIDINRGGIQGLQPARRFGEDYLTYVLWAVSVDGKASNLGEITFKDDRPVSINVTTPIQTFWLLVTAEPDFAVNDPSPVAVLYSTGQADSRSGALHVEGKLVYYTGFRQ